MANELGKRSETDGWKTCVDCKTTVPKTIQSGENDEETICADREWCRSQTIRLVDDALGPNP